MTGMICPSTRQHLVLTMGFSCIDTKPLSQNAIPSASKSIPLFCCVRLLLFLSHSFAPYSFTIASICQYHSIILLSFSWGPTCLLLPPRTLSVVLISLVPLVVVPKQVYAALARHSVVLETVPHHAMPNPSAILDGE